MRRAIITLAWTLVAAGIGLFIGASLFGLIGAALSNPGTRPANWPGWNLLFYGFVIGLPGTLAALTLALGLAGRLPGTQPRPD